MTDAETSGGGDRAQVGGSGGSRVVVSGNTFNVRRESDIEAIATAPSQKIEEARRNHAFAEMAL